MATRSSAAAREEARDLDQISLERLEELDADAAADGGDEEVELEELVEEPEVDTDEHEVELDEILALQFAPGEEEAWAESAEAPAEAGAPVDLSVVPPAGADEFVCRSCFLIKHRRQMADTALCTCRDCAAA